MIKKPLPQNSNSSVIAASLVCVLLSFTACNKNQPQAPTPAPSQLPKTTVALPKPVQKLASSALRLPPTSVNQFDFSNKKDPFKPFMTVKADTKSSPQMLIKTQRDSLPIHSYDVRQFKLIGIIIVGRQNQAMVTDPGGKGYVLKVGMLIGKNDGRIISISSSGVEVLEQYKDENGRVQKENIKLTLPRKQ